jgi:hypothetical protein
VMRATKASYGLRKRAYVLADAPGGKPDVLLPAAGCRGFRQGAGAEGAEIIRRN